MRRLQGVLCALKPREQEGPPRVTANRTHQLGFIARDGEQVLPQLVRIDDTSGHRTASCTGVMPVLVQAIEAQQAIIDAQAQALSAQRASIERPEQAVAALPGARSR